MALLSRCVLYIYDDRISFIDLCQFGDLEKGPCCGFFKLKADRGSTRSRKIYSLTIGANHVNSTSRQGDLVQNSFAHLPVGHAAREEAVEGRGVIKTLRR